MGTGDRDRRPVTIIEGGRFSQPIVADDGRRMQIVLGQDQGQGQDQVTSGSCKQTWKGRALQFSQDRVRSGQVRSH